MGGVTMRNIKRIIALVLMIVVLMPAGSVFAASKRPYKDVRKSEVGSANHKGICWCKEMGVLKEPFKIKNEQFIPFKTVTRGQFFKVLKKTYPKVPKKFFNYSGDKTKPLAIGFMKRWLKKLRSEEHTS